MMPLTKTETDNTDLPIEANGWPGVASHWQIVKTDAAPVLKLLFSMDSLIYDGLLNVKITNPDDKVLTAFYSNELDDKSAVDTANYTINDGVNITGITLHENKKSVDITVDAIPAVPIVLEVNHIARADCKETYSGSATVSADLKIEGTSPLMTKALADKKWYENIFCFNGKKDIQVTVNTSLVPGTGFTWSKEQTDQVINTWLNGIYKFIEERSKGDIGMVPSVLTQEVSFSVDPVALRKDPVFMLTVSLSVNCDKEIPKDTETSEASTSQTAVMPVSCLSDEDGSYSTFVNEFEKAFLTDNLKIALNTSPHESQKAGYPEVCVLRPNTEGASVPGIGYSINTTQVPIPFTPKLLSSRLISKAGVPVYPFDAVKGIDSSNPSFISFSSIDVNVWYRQFFNHFDNLLGPDYSSAIKVLDDKNTDNTSFLKKLDSQKERLADVFKTLLVPVFKDQMEVDLQNVQEDFRQALSVKLSNAYDVKSTLQFRAQVSGNNTQAPAYLYGNILRNAIPDAGTEISNIGFTAGGLLLKTDENAAFNIFMSSSDLIKDKNGRVVPVMPAELSYSASSVAMPDTEDLNDFSRFEFISKDNPILSVKKLSDQAVMVPLPVNEVPAAPLLLGQSGQLIKSEKGRFPPDLMAWNYGFTYSQTPHYPQDTLSFTVDFNLNAGEKNMLSEETADAFTSIAQFITVMPDMTGALEALSRLDAQSGDEAIAAAKTALTAYTDMTENITNSFAGREPDACFASVNMYTGTDSSHRFTVKESSAAVEGTEDVLIITISISEESREVIGIPEMLIDGYQTEPYTFKDGKDGDFCCYFTKDGEPLSANTGQTMAKRTVVLNELNILVQQEVSVSMFLERNAELIPGRPVNPALIYTTDNVTVPDYYPGFSNNDAVDIASLASGKTIKGTMLMHLNSLFALLLQNNKQPVLKYALEVTYDYLGTSDDLRIRLPVMLVPTEEMCFGNNPDKASDSILSDWISRIKNWLNEKAPDTTDALLNFSLTFFSNVTDEKKPLIQFTDVYLKMEDVEE